MEQRTVRMNDKIEKPRVCDDSGHVLIPNLIIAESTLDRMRGLLGRRDLPEGIAMLIRPCRSIHMFLMRFSIDALFLDGDGNILKVHQQLRPWQISLAPKRTRAVLETAAGFIKANSITVGQRLVIK